MLSAALLLLCNSLFLSLHLSGSAGSFPKPLPPEKERECLERCAAGDLEARNLLVEHNLRLVAHIIKKYYTQSGDQEDLISIGTIGLIKAVNTFRPDRGINWRPTPAGVLKMKSSCIFGRSGRCRGRCRSATR